MKIVRLLGILCCLTVLSSCVFLQKGTPLPPIDPGTEASWEIKSWVYQLQNYPGGSLHQLINAPHDLAVIDLGSNNRYFTKDEIAALKASGKKVLAYFSIGTTETYRPEYEATISLRLNQYEDWPQEYFVKFWDPLWWELAIKGRVDQAIAAGFDGIYLDNLGAYNLIDLSLVPGETRNSLADKMIDFVIHISEYAKGIDPEIRVFPQNAPSFVNRPKGNEYLAAVDGIGKESTFHGVSGPCTQSWCASDLANLRKFRDAGKIVLTVDYALSPSGHPSDIFDEVCAQGAAEGFVQYVTTVKLDQIFPPCPSTP